MNGDRQWCLNHVQLAAGRAVPPVELPAQITRLIGRRQAGDLHGMGELVHDHAKLRYGVELARSNSSIAKF